MVVVDDGVILIQLPVICIGIREAARVESKIRVVRPEERADEGVIMFISITFTLRTIKM